MSERIEKIFVDIYPKAMNNETLEIYHLKNTKKKFQPWYILSSKWYKDLTGDSGIDMLGGKEDI